MKLRLKKREPIKDRIGDWFSERNRRWEKRMHDKCAAIQEWHEKFAWYPMRVENDDDDIREWVWLVKVTQKYNAGVQSSEWRPGKTINKFGVERYTSKDYFKKRLQGEVDGKNTSGVDGDFQNMTHDGTDTVITTQGPMKKYELRKKLREIIQDDDDSSKW